MLNKILRIFTDFLVFVVTILILFSLYNLVTLKVFKNNYVNFFGYSIFEIVSGSMEPTLNVEDLIIVKKSKTIEVGDIVTYLYGNDFVTHRIIDINDNYVTTKGDANNSSDVRVDKNKIIGKVIFNIPKGGLWKDILTTPKVIISLIVTLILFSLCISYIPKNKRKKKENIDDNFVDWDLM